MSLAATVWLIAGIAIAAAEVLHPGIYLIWVGLAACGVGAARLIWPLSVEWQLGGFLLLALVLLAPAVWRRSNRPSTDPVNAPGVGIVGRTCKALEFTGAEGRVRFRDATWQAEAVGGVIPLAGAHLRIVGVRGATLLVGVADTEPSAS